MIDHDIIAKDALAIQAEGCGYIWGTSGEMWTEKRQWNLEDEYNADPSKNPSLWGSATYGRRWIGKHVYDCSGLVMRILKNHGIRVPHGSNSQWNESCKAQGTLKKGARDDGKPLRTGTAVFLVKDSNRHHVGIFVGDGLVVEAKSGKEGVVISKITRWHEWGELKGVAYEDAEVALIRESGGISMQTVRKGDSGGDVKLLQQKLNDQGYALEEDGVYGSATLKAVKDFQKARGLTADGIVGPITWAALIAASNIAEGVAAADPLKNCDAQTASGSGTAVAADQISITLPRSTAEALLSALKEVLL